MQYQISMCYSCELSAPAQISLFATYTESRLNMTVKYSLLYQQESFISCIMNRASNLINESTGCKTY